MHDICGGVVNILMGLWQQIENPWTVQFGSYFNVQSNCLHSLYKYMFEYIDLILTMQALTDFQRSLAKSSILLIFPRKFASCTTFSSTVEKDPFERQRQTPCGWKEGDFLTRKSKPLDVGAFLAVYTMLIYDIYQLSGAYILAWSCLLTVVGRSHISRRVEHKRARTNMHTNTHSHTADRVKIIN